VKLVGCLLVLAVLHPFLFAQNSSASSEERTLLMLENAWNFAQVHHDAKSLKSLLDEKFVYTDNDGTVMDKAAFLADIQDPDYKASQVTNEGVKVNLYPNAAVVTGIYHAKGSNKGKIFDHRGRFTDMWIFQNGEWQCIASHTSLLQK